MPSQPQGLPDWRDSDAYAPLLEIERAGIAWEWLRRDGRYRAAALGAGDAQFRRTVDEEDMVAAPWGLHRFENPDLPATLARPIWRAERHPMVLPAEGEVSEENADALSLARLADLATIVRSRGSRHLLLSDGCRSIRVDVAGANPVEGPLLLHYRLSGFEAVHGPLLALRRLLALQRTGRFSPALHPREVRARRFVEMLRAHDAVQAGATQREIAAELLSTDARERRWRVEAPTLRLRAQRLVRIAAAMAGGLYLSLLQ